MQWVFVDAIVRQESDLVRDFIDEHQTRNVVSVDRAFLGTKKQAIITGANVGKESALFAHPANEVTLCVENEHFAVGAENQHEACELRNNALLDLLLDMDAFLQLKSSLRHLPDLDARLLDSQELDRIGQIHLG